MNGSSRQFSRRMQLVYAGQFLAIGTYMPFMPLWLSERGLSAVQIGLVLTVPMLARTFLAPVIAYAADRCGERIRALAALSILSALATGTLFLGSGFAAILAAFAGLALFWCALMPLAEAAAMHGARSRGLDYGRMRLWGSASFIAANLGAGVLVDQVSADAAVGLIAVSFMLTGWFAFGLPQPRGKAGAIAGPFSGADLALLLRPAFLAAIAIASLLNASHMLIYGFGTLHWQGLGHSSLLIGCLWATGVIAEIALFAFSSKVVARTCAWALLMVAALAATLRWVAMAFDPPLEMLFALQVLHGLTFGATHLGIVNLVADAVPSELGGTAQSLMYSVSSLVGALSTLAAGALYGAYGAGAFWAMAAIALGALVLVLAPLGRRAR